MFGHRRGLRLPYLPLGPVLAGALLLSACGGASDVVGSKSDDKPAASGSPSPDSGDTKLALAAFAVPKIAFDKLIPAFTATDAGRGVAFSQSYGASGDQSRKVEAGLETDVVLFSLEPDVTRLVKAGLVDANWKDGEDHGVPASSVVTLVVRKGNPKGIKDWSDLARDEVDIVSPNPFSSGSAKWNLLAPYLWKSEAGKNKAAGLDLVTDIVGNLKGQPKSGREASELFTAGTGDILLSYENEAILLKDGGEDVEYVTPSTTLLIENPFAIINTTEHPGEAKAFRDFVFSDAGQKLWGEAGFRPVDDTIAKDFEDKFPVPKKLYTIDDLGGWDKANELFTPETGDIAKIYDKATA